VPTKQSLSTTIKPSHQQATHLTWRPHPAYLAGIWLPHRGRISLGLGDPSASSCNAVPRRSEQFLRPPKRHHHKEALDGSGEMKPIARRALMPSYQSSAPRPTMRSPGSPCRSLLALAVVVDAGQRRNVQRCCCNAASDRSQASRPSKSIVPSDAQGGCLIRAGWISSPIFLIYCHSPSFLISIPTVSSTCTPLCTAPPDDGQH
jgi:hypothetical protein